MISVQYVPPATLVFLLRGSSHRRTVYDPFLNEGGPLLRSFPLAMLYISAIAFCVLVCLCLLRIYLRKRLTNPLPPGPPADPILGHWRILPESNRKAEVFYDWSLKYGKSIVLLSNAATILLGLKLILQET